jgi:hypothetical protein
MEDENICEMGHFLKFQTFFCGLIQTQTKNRIRHVPYCM